MMGKRQLETGREGCTRKERDRKEGGRQERKEACRSWRQGGRVQTGRKTVRQAGRDGGRVRRNLVE